MKFSKLGLVGFAAAALVLAGCSSEKKEGSMGAVNAEKTCTTKEGCASKEGCTKDASMGAVGEKKSGCCSASKEAAMGAVSEKKSGCCSQTKSN